ncbi:hypothetical protein PHYC_01091 [Phycisphaerales bacterium]|nr:hypothetical protein PHYC_01091 [Phycisphaerales bacterium]
MIRRIAVAYLLVQGVALVAYWLTLALVPAARAPFIPPGCTDDIALFTIALPDCLLYTATSFAGAYGLARSRAWTRMALSVHAGAALYAALLAMGMFVVDRRRPYRGAEAH